MQSEAQFAKINRVFIPAYMILGLALSVYYAVQNDMYHFLLGLGTIALPLVLNWIYRLLGFKRVHQLDFFILMFLVLSYQFGSVLEFYKKIPNYDAIIHTLSGVFVSQLCLGLFYIIHPNHRLEAQDVALAILFVFFGSMAVAGFWEIGEYFIHLITGRDIQLVISTGVSDTMEDMIVCLIGTLVYLAFMIRFNKRKYNFFSNMIEAFLEKNRKRIFGEMIF